MFKIGDLLKKVGYDNYDDQGNYLGSGINYMVMDVEEKKVQITIIPVTMKAVTSYKLLCIETRQYITTTSEAANRWEKST